MDPLDLKKLAWFFEDDVASAVETFREAVGEALAQRYLCAIEDNLMRALFGVTHKVLVAQYRLSGGASYEDFCTSLRDPGVRDWLHAHYPMLRHWMDKACSAWVAQSTSLVRRLASDAALIASSWRAAAEPFEVTSIRFGAGDKHRGGHSVAILTCGDGWQFVYKPRSLSFDANFDGLLAWINARAGTDVAIPRHLDRGAYGWVTFVEECECADPHEVDLFYERLGVLLAILYALEATDFHYENIIASGGQPVLVDLESFFRPYSPIEGGEANEGIDLSVLKTGILPSRIGLAENEPDISGMSDAEGQPGILSRMDLVQGEEGLALVRAKGGLVGAQNVPRLHGAKVRMESRLVGCLQRGFENGYRTILTNRDEFVRQVEAFSNDTIRVIFRHTVAYVHLLEEALHPVLLRSQSALAEHLGLLNLVVPDYGVVARFVDAERDALLDGDIPLFTTRAGSRDLDCGGGKVIPDFFSRSGLDAVKRKVALLSEQDLGRQQWIIANAFAPSSAATNRRANTQVPDRAERNSVPLETRLVDYAVDVAGRISAQFHVDARHASWMVHTSKSLDAREYQSSPAFYDLYYGMPGPMLFLSQLAAITGEHRYRELAGKALAHLSERLALAAPSIRPLGFYAGWGSIVALLTRMGARHGHEQALATLDRLIDQIALGELLSADHNYGLLKGAAGMIVACVERHGIDGAARWLDMARACGSHLLATRDRHCVGAAWRITSAVPLAGLAHGASGVGLAFARLYGATGESKWRQAALGTVEYERSLFVEQAGNWRDCRDFVVQKYGDQPYCSTAWSHGAPGIGLARLAMIEAGIDTAAIRNDLDVALRTTAAHGFDGDDSLVYGRFGSLELLLAAGRMDTVRAIATPGLDRLEAREERLTAPLRDPVGLMSGITGLGYQALRLARPLQVPSVLCAPAGILPCVHRPDAGDVEPGVAVSVP